MTAMVWKDTKSIRTDFICTSHHGKEVLMLSI